LYYVEKLSWTLFLPLNKSKTVTLPPTAAFTNSNLHRFYNSREFLTDCPVRINSQLCCDGDLRNNIHSNTLPCTSSTSLLMMYSRAPAARWRLPPDLWLTSRAFPTTLNLL